MENYSTISSKKSPDEKSAEKKAAVSKGSGGVKIKKRSKFAELFIKEDIDTVKDHVVKNVIVPGIINIVINGVNNALSMFLTGSASGSGYQVINTSKTGYSTIYSRRNSQPVEIGSANRTRYDSFAFTTEADAKKLLAGMVLILEKYKICSVEDMFDLIREMFDNVNIESSHTDSKRGWTDFSNVDIVQTRDGWVLRLPHPMPID